MASHPACWALWGFAEVAAALVVHEGEAEQELRLLWLRLKFRFKFRFRLIQLWLESGTVMEEEELMLS